MSPTLVPDPTHLRLLCLTSSETTITMVVCTRKTEGQCPLCDRPAHRVHSRYQRILADLPWNGIAVRLRLQTRRFFCENQECTRRIFTERIPTVAAPYARRTQRLSRWFTQVAFALGGAPGARLLRSSSLSISRDTLLALVRAFSHEDAATPTVLSIDDFAFRRGRTYGSILVDLERHRVVDLLPDRSADTIAAWLREHPGVEVVSRDRGGEYAEGTKRGAPDAVQVADRFHLLRNLGDVTRRVLQRHAPALQRVPVPGPSTMDLTRRRLDRVTGKQQTRATMQERHDRIQALAAEGLSKNAIATRLGLNRKTVYKYLALSAPPERQHATRQRSALAPYEGYILRRWTEGCCNARALWRELQDQGYKGAYQNVERIMAYLRRQQRLGQSAPEAPSGLSPRWAVGLVLQRDETRTANERKTLAQVKSLAPEIRQTITLLEGFIVMLRQCPHERPHDRLQRWMAEVDDADVPEFQAFVTKLRQDEAAVVAGLQLPWSQGQIEGQINRLKTIKRGMYGRAGFDLLKQRILYTAAA